MIGKCHRSLWPPAGAPWPLGFFSRKGWDYLGHKLGDKANLFVSGRVLESIFYIVSENSCFCFCECVRSGWMCSLNQYKRENACISYFCVTVLTTIPYRNNVREERGFFGSSFRGFQSILKGEAWQSLWLWVCTAKAPHIIVDQEEDMSLN